MILTSQLEEQLKTVKEGFALTQPFYIDPTIFQADARFALQPLWHIAGLASQIPRPGDYYLHRIMGEEIIVIRDDDGRINALYNVCRHRGSRVCLEAEGNRRMLVCPYHAWSYRSDGSLAAARLMPPDFDESRYGLHRCAVKVAQGVIFVCLADSPPDFEKWIEPYQPYLDFHGIADTRIAKRLSLPTTANWKLVVENFIECYHCIPSHPEYCSVHSKAKLLAAGAGAGSGPAESQAEFDKELLPFLQRTAARGQSLPVGEFDNGGATARMPIKEGFVTESRDGKPLAPLLGKLTEYDGGISYLAFNYLNYLFIANDYAIMVRFRPQSELLTDVDAFWLVRSDAEPGTDYDAEEVAWLWRVTLEQDLIITEDNQRGVMSRRYEPGPYSTQEAMNVSFANWYVANLRAG